MVVIRLSRGGAKKRPFYHIVATDSRNRRDGRYIERLGYYNPIARGNEIALHIETDRVEHWLAQGAKASERVEALVKSYKKNGEITGAQQMATKEAIRAKKPKAAPVVEEAVAEEATTEEAASEE